MVSIEPPISVQAPPEGWVAPPLGAVIVKPPSLRVSAHTSTPPFSPGFRASFVLPGKVPSDTR